MPYATVRLVRLLRQTQHLACLSEAALLTAPLPGENWGGLLTPAGQFCSIPWPYADPARFFAHNSSDYTLLPLASEPVMAWLVVRWAAPQQAPAAGLSTVLARLADAIRHDLSPTLTTEHDWTGQLYQGLCAPLPPEAPGYPFTRRRLREQQTLLWFHYGLQRALRLNEQMHFFLSVVTAERGGGFERAMLFLANARSESLQGMLGVTRNSSAMLLPPAQGLRAWKDPRLDEPALEAQRREPFCRLVMQQRLPLRENGNPVATCALRKQLVTVPRDTSLWGQQLAELLPFDHLVCVPLAGRRELLGVLVVDARAEQCAPGSEYLRFLELLAYHAGIAMENALLVRRLEQTNDELQETRDRLLQGEKLALLGEAVASVSHEIKTPLIAIGGFARRLKALAESEVAQRYAEIVQRETRRLEAILGATLSLARKELICYVPCNLTALLQEVLQLEADLLVEARVTVQVEIADTLPAVQADCDRLKQVLINLLANAREAMPQGGEIRVRAQHGVLHGAAAVEIEIEDSGSGIPPALHRQIFDSFFTTKASGTGLGLPITARIVEQHHGELTAHTSPRGGALFRLLLPATPAMAE